jgi:hypothetical protein
MKFLKNTNFRNHFTKNNNKKNKDQIFKEEKLKG